MEAERGSDGMNQRKCWIDGCTQASISWGMCQVHYDLWVALVKLPRTRLLGSDLEKYEFYILRNPPIVIQETFGARSDCWVWRGGLTSYGYGSFTSSWCRHQGGSNRVHLFVLSQMVGIEINPHQETDHRCRFRPCSNPDHLERVDQRTNTLRGVSPVAKNARKTHCDNGHEFTPENTFVTDEGWRECRECNRMRNREYTSRPEVRKARRESYEPKTGVRGKGQYQAQRDTCRKGHELEGDNLIQEKRNRNGVVSYVRRCRTCVNEKARANHAKRTGGK